MVSKIISKVKVHESELLLIITVICITIISFNAGRKYGTVIERTVPIKYSSASIDKPIQKAIKPLHDYINTAVIASKNSKSKLYHYPWCSGYGKITEKNKITFKNAAEAEQKGYTMASNCK